MIRLCLAALLGFYSFIAAPSALFAQDEDEKTEASAKDTDPGNSALLDSEGAIAFIQKLSEETRSVWQNKDLDALSKSAAFQTLFEKATDVELLGRAMLGHHFRKASSAQQSAYLKTVRDYIIAEFDRRMTQIGFRSLMVTGTSPAPGSKGHIFVRTRIEREEGDPILADWRVRKKAGQFQIVNLEVEGINLVITNRELFSARVKEIGLDGLIEELEEDAKADFAAE